MLGPDFELLCEITIPMYRRTYIKSNSMRAKYYEKGRKKLPLRYCNQALYKTQGILEPDGVKYAWKSFPVVRRKIRRMSDFLIEVETGKRVVANEEYVGKANVANINGQNIFNGKIREHDRNNMIGQIKDQLRMFVSATPPVKRFPIVSIIEVHDILVDTVYSNGQDWDIGNRLFPYQKAIEDVLQDTNIIPDDCTKYVTSSPWALFCPIEDTNNRKFVIKLYKDNRAIILNNPLYQEIHKEKLK